MDDEQVWAAVDARRAGLVELLSGLAQRDWELTSVCPEWTIKDVAAHLRARGNWPDGTPPTRSSSNCGP